MCSLCNAIWYAGNIDKDCLMWMLQCQPSPVCSPYKETVQESISTGRPSMEPLATPFIGARGRCMTYSARSGSTSVLEHLDQIKQLCRKVLVILNLVVSLMLSYYVGTGGACSSLRLVR